jgi:hypothetical protein
MNKKITLTFEKNSMEMGRYVIRVDGIQINSFIDQDSADKVFNDLLTKSCYVKILKEGIINI